jgi:hypothetical protein
VSILEEQVITLDNSTTITPKKQGRVNVFLNNADFKATAVNWAAIIPDGIELVKQSDGHYITMSDRMSDNFILFDYLDGNVLHVLACRISNHVMEPMTSPSPIMSFDVKLQKDASPAVDENGMMLQKIEFVSDSESDADQGFDKLVTGRERRGNLTIDDQGKAWVTWEASCLIEIGEDNPADDIPPVTIGQVENGSVTYNSEGTTVTLTVTPADNYFITPDDIKVEKIVDGGVLVQAPEIADLLTVSPVDVDDRGRGTYTFTIKAGDCVQVSTTFTECLDLDLSVSIDGWTFGDQPSIPSIIGNESDGAVTVTYAAQGSESFISDPPSDAGYYTVKVTVDAKGHYNSATVTCDFVIAPATITEAKLKIDRFIYNESSHIVEIESVKAGDLVVPESGYTVEGTLEATDIDNYSITVMGVGNYDGSVSVDYQIVLSDIPGDANGNGVVDENDKDAIVRYIMEGDEEGFIFRNADVNEDGEVNAADIVLIVNKIK